MKLFVTDGEVGIFIAFEIKSNCRVTDSKDRKGFFFGTGTHLSTRKIRRLGSNDTSHKSSPTKPKGTAGPSSHPFPSGPIGESDAVR
jgi:hypothetical protein